jgi:type I restriction enzyme R subunit
MTLINESNIETFHQFLVEKVKIPYQQDGYERSYEVALIDFSNPSNNEFLVVNQYMIIENNRNKRPDILLFVNGIPIVLFELKNAADENATIRKAFDQIRTYKATIPGLFTYNAICIISDGMECRAGSVSAGFSRYMTWKSADGKKEASRFISQLEILIKGMLNPTTLLDLVRNFIIFEKSKKKDAQTGITQVETEKKLAAYHQYYAVNKAVESTLRASGYVPVKEWLHSENIIEEPENYGLPGVKKQPIGDGKGGVVWHTQGSGKSLSMVFFTGKIVLAMDNPTILVITDRNDLDDQLFDTFAASKQLLRQEPVQAENREHLKELLNVASGGVIFTTIQKFQPEEGNVYPKLSDRRNIIVIVDEAHRTQYGFKAKTIDAKDDQGNVIGKKIVYGFAKYTRDALPNATYIGFTGTPIEKTDVNTPAVFGNYVDVYDISKAVEDGATVKIYYESRLAKIALSEEGKKLVAELDEELETEDLAETQKAKAKWTQLEALIGSEGRIRQIAKDIVTHFEQRQEVFEGKGMIVAMSRRIAANLYDEIVKIKPQWHNDDLNKGVIKVVMTSASSDGPKISKHHTTKEQRRALAERMKDPEDELKLEIVSQMFHGFSYEHYFTADISTKLSMILAAEEHILGLENGKKRYIDEVTALSRAFSIAIPHEQAMDVKDEVSFYQAIKSRLVKFDSTGTGKTDEEIETAIRQVIDQALVTEQVIDIFDAAGIKKPDISILSEEFLLEVQNMEHKNIALEVLKKLLNDEIKGRLKKNLVESRSLMEMLEDSIKKYHNKVITAAEVIKELIELSKEIKKMDKEPQEMGLSDFEYAFYTAIADNDSARELMQKDKLRELAVVLFERVKQNASIDWTIKESVRSKLKVIVKRTLRQYGYPPDMQALATETVLKQAELIADELTRKAGGS